VFSGGTLLYSTVNTFDYSSRFSTAGGQPISIDTAGQSVTFASVLAGAGSSLTKLGAGTLTLTATNTLSGGVTVSNGTVALGANGSVSNVSGIAISPGAFFDVSLRSSWNLGPTSSLTGSGTASPATLNGAGVLSLSATSPVILNYDGTHPALTVSGGTLSLHGNAFTVNAAAPLPNSATPYVVATASTPITSVGPYTVSGTAIGPTSQATITVSGTQVLLTVTSLNLQPPTFGFGLNGNVLSLSWPTNSGWILQSNSLNIAVPGDWFDVAGSSNVTTININVNTAKTNVYYRLRLP
jgi:autotransporter-associated beta strand protein